MCGQAAQYIRIVWLPVTVVAFGNERSPDGVKKSRTETTGPFIEVARVLVKHGLGEGMADQDMDDAGGIVRAKALAIPFHPLAELAVSVLCHCSIPALAALPRMTSGSMMVRNPS